MRLGPGSPGPNQWGQSQPGSTSWAQAAAGWAQVVGRHKEALEAWRGPERWTREGTGLEREPLWYERWQCCPWPKTEQKASRRVPGKKQGVRVPAGFQGGCWGGWEGPMVRGQSPPSWVVQLSPGCPPSPRLRSHGAPAVTRAS